MPGEYTLEMERERISRDMVEMCFDHLRSLGWSPEGIFYLVGWKWNGDLSGVPASEIHEFLCDLIDADAFLDD